MNTNAKNKRDLDWLVPFSSETETGDFVPPYTVLPFRHGFHSQNLSI